MVTETPIGEAGAPGALENQEAQETTAQEIGETPEAPGEEITEEESAPVEEEPEEPAEPAPPKRKPGRPKKNPEAKPKAAPKAPRPKAKAPPAQSAQASSPVVPPFRATLDTMSSAQLVAELVNRRRQTEREIKQNLYRSFVM